MKAVNTKKTHKTICFFGASVTAQSTGYAALLKKELNADVEVFGFGGMHIKDAGICYIDDVLACHPSICFIDWFSTGYSECTPKTEELIDTIIYRFTKASCKLIFCFFPYKANKANEAKKEFHIFCKKILEKRNMAMIDVIQQLGEKTSVEEILRDPIHTNDHGSRLYADVIKEAFEKMENELTLPKNIQETKYIKIRKVIVEREFTKRLLLEGDCEIIGIHSVVGPYSGVLEVSDRNGSYKINTWDRWCHYTRDAFFLNHNLEDYAKIEILDDIFDTSACKVKMDFSAVEKKIVVKKVFFVGKKLRIANKKEGTRIYSNRDCVLNLLRRCKRSICGVVRRVKTFI